MRKSDLNVTLTYAKDGSARELIRRSFIRYLSSKLLCRKN